MPYRFISYYCQDHKQPLWCKIEGDKVICPQCGECKVDKKQEEALLEYSYSTLGVSKKNFRMM